MINNRHLKVVSCIYVLSNDGIIERTMDCFVHQDYPDKELLIIGEECYREKILTDYGQWPLKFIVATSQSSNLERFQLGVNAARGANITSWSDGVWWHPERLRLQLTALESGNHNASMVIGGIVFEDHSGIAYLYNDQCNRNSLVLRSEVLLRKWAVSTHFRFGDESFVDSLIMNENVIGVTNSYLCVEKRKPTGAHELSRAAAEIVMRIKNAPFDYGSKLMQGEELACETSFFCRLKNELLKRVENSQRYHARGY